MRRLLFSLLCLSILALNAQNTEIDLNIVGDSNKVKISQEHTDSIGDVKSKLKLKGDKTDIDLDQKKAVEANKELGLWDWLGRTELILSIIVILSGGMGFLIKRRFFRKKSQNDSK